MNEEVRVNIYLQFSLVLVLIHDNIHNISTHEIPNLYDSILNFNHSLEIIPHKRYLYFQEDHGDQWLHYWSFKLNTMSPDTFLTIMIKNNVFPANFKRYILMSLITKLCEGKVNWLHANITFFWVPLNLCFVPYKLCPLMHFYIFTS